ncbi:hypothetical protein [Paracidobacterium acidisoli]|nr:hypothetical protein [Paracidobacterium acidisoli]MBT9332673.1 hypothetical protein [Paracidobacterium acidisoli]
MPPEYFRLGSGDALPESLKIQVEALDPLLIRTMLGIASLMPGFAGEAGAVAAITYDIKQRRWDGVALSTASLIPIVGYIPGIIKAGLLLFALNHRLNDLEAMLPEIHSSPEASSIVENALSKYYRKVPDLWVTRPLRKRLGRIMGLDKEDCPAPFTPSESSL